jgi:hypothetical protein
VNLYFYTELHRRHHTPVQADQLQLSS